MLSFNYKNNIVTIYSDYLQNRSGDFLFDPTIDFNLIEGSILVPFIQSKNYNSESIIIPILCEEFKFNIIKTGLSSSISGIVGSKLIKSLVFYISDINVNIDWYISQIERYKFEELRKF